MSPIKQKTRHLALLALTAMLLMGLFSIGASAADRETLYNADYCFEEADFTAAGDLLTGIFITEVPSATVGQLCYGDRVLRSGDVLPAAALASLTLSPTCDDDQEASVAYLPITADGVGAVQTLKIGISSGKNEAPTAADGTMETYKNVAKSGTLEVSDPEGDSLCYNLTAAPKRGTVEFADDGTYTYTPAKNKVGKDSFTYTVTDESGNVSNEATVKIEILKPMDSVTYGDMSGDPDQFTAMWLREQQLFSGESVAGVTCFYPEKTVTRGEFLVMVSRMAGLEPDDAQMTSGFADESTTPQWMRPYIVSALRAGVISGINSEDGLVFRPNESLTAAEAAVMLQNLLHLPEAQETAAFEDSEAVPTWAASAMGALSDAGLPVSATGCTEPITRRDAAKLLYAASALLDGDSDSSFF